MSKLRDNREECPHCGAQLQGGPIPKADQHLFGATHFSEKIGLEYIDLYDGVWEWQCPKCLGKWSAR